MRKIFKLVKIKNLIKIRKLEIKIDWYWWIEIFKNWWVVEFIRLIL